jgi:hypothetical protein
MSDHIKKGQQVAESLIKDISEAKKLSQKIGKQFIGYKSEVICLALVATLETFEEIAPGAYAEAEKVWKGL